MDWKAQVAALAAVRKREEHLQNALDQAGISLFTIDPDLHCDWLFEPILPATRLLGVVDPQAAPETSAARLAGIYRRVLDTGIAAREIVEIQDGGQTWYYDLGVRPQQGPGPDGKTAGIQVSALDITHHVKTESALRQSEARYHRMVETAGEGIWTIDPAGKIDFINYQASHFLGYTPEQLHGRSPLEFLVPQDIERFEQAFRESIHQVTEPVEFRVRHRDGSLRWISYTASPMLGEAGAYQGALCKGIDITAQKTAEDALQKNEERFRSLVETTSDWIWEVDAEGVYTYASPRIKDLLGYDPEEVLGKTPFDLMPAEEGERLAPLVRRIFAAAAPIQALENLNRHKDGHMVLLETSGLPVFTENGILSGYRGIDRDITARKEVESALRDTQRKTQEILESISDGFFQLDRDWRFTYLNERAAQNVGYTPDHLIGTVIWDVLPGVLGSPHETNYRKVMDSRVPDQFEMEGIFTSKWYHIRVYPSSQGITVYWVDITASKQAELALRESEQRFRLMGDTIPYGFWMTDPQGRAYYSSQSFLDLLGMTLEEMRAFGWTRRLPPEDVDRVKQGWTHCVQTGENWDCEYDILGPDEQYHTVLSQGRPVRDEDGTITCWVGLSLDITDRKRLEEQRRQDASRIEVQRLILAHREQERLQIARDLHDGPVQELAAAAFTLQGMLMDGQTAEIAEQLEAIRSTLQRQIADLRTYASELRPPTLVKFGLIEAIRSHIESFRDKNPDVQIYFEESGDCGVQPEHIRMALYRIFQETMNNIAKHAGATRITIQCFQDAACSVIEIRDNGRGFEVPHRWVDLARQGHLGMVGIQERAEAVGGHVEIKSQRGSGTCVRVMIPLVPLENNSIDI